MIPESVTTIGNYAFRYNQLKSVTISDGVETIGYFAFESNQLESVMIPKSVTTIGADAFSHNQLKSVTISDGVETIGNYAFDNNQLESVMIPNSVTSIGTWAFGRNQLKSVIILNAAIHYGESSSPFNNNPSITIYSYDPSTTKTHAQKVGISFTNELEVTFKEVNGDELGKRTVNFGSLINNANAPTKEGYTIAGLYKDVDLTKPWDLAVDKVTENNLTLYAKWTKTTSSGGGGSSSPGPTPNPTPKPDSAPNTDAIVGAPEDVEAIVKDGKLQIQLKDEQTGEWKPALIENQQSIGGILIIQTGNKGEELQSIDLPKEGTKVVVLHPIRIFRAQRILLLQRNGKCNFQCH